MRTRPKKPALICAGSVGIEKVDNGHDVTTSESEPRSCLLYAALVMGTPGTFSELDGVCPYAQYTFKFLFVLGICAAAVQLYYYPFSEHSSACEEQTDWSHDAGGNAAGKQL